MERIFLSCLGKKIVLRFEVCKTELDIKACTCTLNFKRKHVHPVDLKFYKIELFALKGLELPRKKKNTYLGLTFTGSQFR